MKTLSEDLAKIKTILEAVYRIFSLMEKAEFEESWWWLTEQTDVRELLEHWDEIENKAKELEAK